MTTYWVNAPGAKSVPYGSKRQAEKVAKQVKGATVSKGKAKPGPRHAHADKSSSFGVGTPVPAHKSWWQKLVG